jgi:hypothetical protein
MVAGFLKTPSFNLDTYRMFITVADFFCMGFAEVLSNSFIKKFVSFPYHIQMSLVSISPGSRALLFALHSSKFRSFS